MAKVETVDGAQRPWIACRPDFGLEVAESMHHLKEADMQSSMGLQVRPSELAIAEAEDIGSGPSWKVCAPGSSFTLEQRGVTAPAPAQPASQPGEATPCGT